MKDVMIKKFLKDEWEMIEHCTDDIEKYNKKILLN